MEHFESAFRCGAAGRAAAESEFWLETLQHSFKLQENFL